MTPSSRQRLMRPVAPDTFDIVINTWIGHPSGESGHWSETRWGRIRQVGADRWQAVYMVGDNPQEYPIEGSWPTAADAAIAVDEYSLEQARIGQAQYAYERANGWSTD